MWKTVLLVEDDVALASIIERNLRKASLKSLIAPTLGIARSQLRASKPDVVVLDIILPDGSGHDLLSDIRLYAAHIPVIITTSLNEEEDRLICLQSGAVDYLSKPYYISELVQRIIIQMQRSPSQLKDHLIVRSEQREIVCRGIAIHLTRKEFDLLIGANAIPWARAI